MQLLIAWYLVVLTKTYVHPLFPVMNFVLTHSLCNEA